MVHTQLYHRIRDFVVHRILRVDDTPSRIARGVAIGVFIAWLPLSGVQMLLILLFSFICRANKVVGLPFAWISNVFTLVPVYYPSYLLGSVILGRDILGAHDFEQHIAELFVSSTPWSGRAKDLLEFLFGGIYYPTLIGSLIIGAGLAAASYFLTFYAVKWHRARRAAKHSEMDQSTPS